MKPKIKIKQNLLVVLLLILILSTAGFGQTSKLDESVIPKQIKKQIVRKVLAYYFKPRSEKKIIYLDDEGINKSWMPKIKGVEILFNESPYYFFVENPFQEKLKDKRSETVKLF